MSEKVVRLQNGNRENDKQSMDLQVPSFRQTQVTLRDRILIIRHYQIKWWRRISTCTGGLSIATKPTSSYIISAGQNFLVSWCLSFVTNGTLPYNYRIVLEQKPLHRHHRFKESSPTLWSRTRITYTVFSQASHFTPGQASHFTPEHHENTIRSTISKASVVGFQVINSQNFKKMGGTWSEA